MKPMVALLLVAATVSAQAQAPSPDLATVLQRAGLYVRHFYEQLSGIVAEESYTQKWSRIVRTGGMGNQKDLGLRELHSDLALVHPVGWDQWLQVRDVFEVDHAPVRDHAERLTQLFLQPSPTADDQVRRIKTESARYNLGDIVRNVNTPLFALEILRPSRQARFRFTRTTKQDIATIGLSPDTAGVFRAAIEVWIIEYDEISRPTLIRTGKNANKDLRAHGRVWIEPDTGRVLMTELRADDRHIHCTIDVSYQSEPLLGLLVPVEMREDYRDDRGSHITGIATYSKFRQFEVNVDEQFQIKR